MDLEDTFDEEVGERDLCGRYIRFDEILWKGASKIVYKAFDEAEGIEVAWSKFKINEEIIKFKNNLEVKSIKHENITKCYSSWVDHGNQTVNMITELFTSGSLRNYRKKHKKVELKAIKNWGKQILKGLMHLHSHSPPIVHGDLECHNIFVNGNAGRIKIAVFMDQPTKAQYSISAFTAPELYDEDEDYNEVVDIYSFGMCMLEMFTCELPYGECEDNAQLMKKVRAGMKPGSLDKVCDPQARQLIEKCLVPAARRPSAAELLKDPFFGPCLKSEAVQKEDIVISNKSNSFTLTGNKEDEFSISMTLRIVDDKARFKDVCFLFSLLTDTNLSVAAEMGDALDLVNEDVLLIGGLMDDLINTLLKGSEPESVILSKKSSPTPALADHNGEYCDGLTKELATIDFHYQRRLAELSNRKEAAIKQAKKKWKGKTPAVSSQPPNV